MKQNCGNLTSKTKYFPVRLPHDLRRDLDRVSNLTGQPRSQILFDAARGHLAQLLNNNSSNALPALES
jgi:metal-responsive CopG/Arc/MetJ family transcriptional regulator